MNWDWQAVADFMPHFWDGLLVTLYRRKVHTFTETAVSYCSNPATCRVWP